MVELNLRHRFSANVIAIKNADEMKTPNPEYVFKESDTILVLGKLNDMGELVK